MHQKKRLFFLIAGIILLVASAGLFFYGLHTWEMDQSEAITAKYRNEEDDQKEPDLVYQNQEYRLKDHLETTLVFGIDKTSEYVEENEEIRRNHQQADFLVLVVNDKDSNTSRMLQLNRDTMTQITELGVFGDKVGTTVEQLALSHTYGDGSNDSCRNVVQAVSDLLGGIPIDHYVSLTMDSVGILNDAVGGVPVYIDEDFSNTDPSLVQGQTITLQGDHALNYVRARGGMDEPTNTARMQRQGKYLQSLYSRLKEMMNTDQLDITDLVLDISPYMVSDMSASVLSDVLTSAFENASGEIETIPGESKVGEEFMEFYPDQDALQAEVVDLFYTPAESSSE